MVGAIRLLGSVIGLAGGGCRLNGGTGALENLRHCCCLLNRHRDHCLLSFLEADSLAVLDQTPLRLPFTISIWLSRNLVSGARIAPIGRTGGTPPIFVP